MGEARSAAVLIDLHCHTLPLSSCSGLTADALVALAKERGLDGVCLTEHDRVWPRDELAALRERTGLLVLSGVEYSTDVGHVLAYGLEPGNASLALAADLFALAQEQGALLFLAHPARDGLLRVNHDTVTWFESVEAINGSDSRLQNMAATGLAHGFRLPGIGGSDAHSRAEVGRAATRFEATINDEGSLVAALRSAAYQAVHLE
ncbi:hypothetical protein AYO38_01255 [bacterium SCGC AG-212-C10]|nr:hypothetical protein AYO38_01255 [bacterium SCGC AG-212-C10]